MIRQGQLTILAVIIALATALVILIINYPAQILLISGAGAGWLLFIAQWLYNHWDTFYLAVQRVKYKLFGLDTAWRFSTRYRGNFSTHTLKSIRASLAQLPGARVTYQSDTKYIIEVFDASLSIGLEVDSPEYTYIELDFGRLTVTYNKALAMIRKQVLPVIESLEKTITPQVSDYYFTLSFDGNNPFFGLMLSRVKPSSVSQFNVVFQIDSNRVEVARDQLTVHTTSLAELREMSGNILSLAPNALAAR